MELNWIEDFLALAESGSFSVAAKLRNVSQPTLSRRIHALELWVGSGLFDRTSNRVSLTAAGRDFMPDAGEILRRAHLGRERAREAGMASTQSIRFASTHLLSSSFFPNWIIEIETEAERDFPFQFLVDNMVSCEASMTRGDVRLLLCHHNDQAPSVLDTRAFTRLPLAEDSLVPVSAAGRDGSALFPIDLSRSSIPYLAHRVESGLARILNRSGLLEQLDGRLTPIFHAHAALTLLRLARAGRGMTWIPRSAVHAEMQRGELVLAGGPEWEIPIEVCLIRATARQGEGFEAFWASVRAWTRRACRPVGR